MNDTLKQSIVGAGLVALGAIGAQAIQPGFDCKGTDCQIQVKAKKDYLTGGKLVHRCSDAIYYLPDVWNEKTAQDLDDDKNQRCDKEKAFIDEQSKKDHEITD